MEQIVAVDESALSLYNILILFLHANLSDDIEKEVNKLIGLLEYKMFKPGILNDLCNRDIQEMQLQMKFKIK